MTATSRAVIKGDCISSISATCDNNHFTVTTQQSGNITVTPSGANNTKQVISGTVSVSYEANGSTCSKSFTVKHTIQPYSCYSVNTPINVDISNLQGSGGKATLGWSATTRSFNKNGIEMFPTTVTTSSYTIDCQANVLCEEKKINGSITWDNYEDCSSETGEDCVINYSFRQPSGCCCSSLTIDTSSLDDFKFSFMDSGRTSAQSCRITSAYCISDLSVNVTKNPEYFGASIENSNGLKLFVWPKDRNNSSGTRISEITVSYSANNRPTCSRKIDVAQGGSDIEACTCYKVTSVHYPQVDGNSSGTSAVTWDYEEHAWNTLGEDIMTTGTSSTTFTYDKNTTCSPRQLTEYRTWYGHYACNINNNTCLSTPTLSTIKIGVDQSSGCCCDSLRMSTDDMEFAYSSTSATSRAIIKDDCVGGVSATCDNNHFTVTIQQSGNIKITPIDTNNSKSVISGTVTVSYDTNGNICNKSFKVVHKCEPYICYTASGISVPSQTIYSSGGTFIFTLNATEHTYDEYGSHSEESLYHNDSIPYGPNTTCSARTYETTYIWSSHKECGSNNDVSQAISFIQPSGCCCNSVSVDTSNLTTFPFDRYGESNYQLCDITSGYCNNSFSASVTSGDSYFGAKIESGKLKIWPKSANASSSTRGGTVKLNYKNYSNQCSNGIDINVFQNGSNLEACTCYNVKNVVYPNVDGNSSGTATVTWYYDKYEWDTLGNYSMTHGSDSYSYSYSANTSYEPETEQILYTWAGHNACDASNRCTSNVCKFYVGVNKTPNCDCSCLSFEKNSIEYPYNDYTFETNAITSGKCISIISANCDNNHFAVEIDGNNVKARPISTNETRQVISGTVSVSYTSHGSSCTDKTFTVLQKCKPYSCYTIDEQEIAPTIGGYVGSGGTALLSWTAITKTYDEYGAQVGSNVGRYSEEITYPANVTCNPQTVRDSYRWERHRNCSSETGEDCMIPYLFTQSAGCCCDSLVIDTSELSDFAYDASGSTKQEVFEITSGYCISSISPSVTDEIKYFDAFIDTSRSALIIRAKDRNGTSSARTNTVLVSYKANGNDCSQSIKVTQEASPYTACTCYEIDENSITFPSVDGTSGGSIPVSWDYTQHNWDEFGVDTPVSSSETVNYFYPKSTECGYAEHTTPYPWYRHFKCDNQHKCTSIEPTITLGVIYVSGCCCDSLSFAQDVLELGYAQGSTGTNVVTSGVCIAITSVTCSNTDKFTVAIVSGGIKVTAKSATTYSIYTGTVTVNYTANGTACSTPKTFNVIQKVQPQTCYSLEDCYVDPSVTIYGSGGTAPLTIRATEYKKDEYGDVSDTQTLAPKFSVEYGANPNCTSRTVTGTFTWSNHHICDSQTDVYSGYSFTQPAGCCCESLTVNPSSIIFRPTDSGTTGQQTITLTSGLCITILDARFARTNYFSVTRSGSNLIVQANDRNATAYDREDELVISYNSNGSTCTNKRIPITQVARQYEPCTCYEVSNVTFPPVGGNSSGTAQVTWDYTQYDWDAFGDVTSSTGSSSTSYTYTKNTTCSPRQSKTRYTWVGHKACDYDSTHKCTSVDDSFYIGVNQGAGCCCDSLTLASNTLELGYAQGSTGTNVVTSGGCIAITSVSCTNTDKFDVAIVSGGIKVTAKSATTYSIYSGTVTVNYTANGSSCTAKTFDVIQKVQPQECYTIRSYQIPGGTIFYGTGGTFTLSLYVTKYNYDEYDVETHTSYYTAVTVSYPKNTTCSVKHVSNTYTWSGHYGCDGGAVASIAYAFDQPAGCCCDSLDIDTATTVTLRYDASGTTGQQYVDFTSGSCISNVLVTVTRGENNFEAAIVNGPRLRIRAKDRNGTGIDRDGSITISYKANGIACTSKTIRVEQPTSPYTECSCYDVSNISRPTGIDASTSGTAQVTWDYDKYTWDAFGEYVKTTGSSGTDYSYPMATTCSSGKSSMNYEWYGHLACNSTTHQCLSTNEKFKIGIDYVSGCCCDSLSFANSLIELDYAQGSTGTNLVTSGGCISITSVTCTNTSKFSVTTVNGGIKVTTKSVATNTINTCVVTVAYKADGSSCTSKTFNVTQKCQPRTCYSLNSYQIIGTPVSGGGSLTLSMYATKYEYDDHGVPTTTTEYLSSSITYGTNMTCSPRTISRTYTWEDHPACDGSGNASIAYSFTQPAGCCCDSLSLTYSSLELGYSQSSTVSNPLTSGSCISNITATCNNSNFTVSAENGGITVKANSQNLYTTRSGTVTVSYNAYGYSCSSTKTFTVTQKCEPQTCYSIDSYSIHYAASATGGTLPLSLSVTQYDYNEYGEIVSSTTLYPEVNVTYTANTSCDSKTVSGTYVWAGHKACGSSNNATIDYFAYSSMTATSRAVIKGDCISSISATCDNNHFTVSTQQSGNITVTPSGANNTREVISGTVLVSYKANGSTCTSKSFTVKHTIQPYSCYTVSNTGVVGNIVGSGGTATLGWTATTRSFNKYGNESLPTQTTSSCTISYPANTTCGINRITSSKTWDNHEDCSTGEDCIVSYTINQPAGCCSDSLVIDTSGLDDFEYTDSGETSAQELRITSAYCISIVGVTVSKGSSYFSARVDNSDGLKLYIWPKDRNGTSSSRTGEVKLSYTANGVNYNKTVDVEQLASPFTPCTCYDVGTVTYPSVDGDSSGTVTVSWNYIKYNWDAFGVRTQTPGASSTTFTYDKNTTCSSRQLRENRTWSGYHECSGTTHECTSNNNVVSVGVNQGAASCCCNDFSIDTSDMEFAYDRTLSISREFTSGACISNVTAQYFGSTNHFSATISGNKVKVTPSGMNNTKEVITGTVFVSYKANGIMCTSKSFTVKHTIQPYSCYSINSMFAPVQNVYGSGGDYTASLNTSKYNYDKYNVLVSSGASDTLNVELPYSANTSCSSRQYPITYTWSGHKACGSNNDAQWTFNITQPGGCDSLTIDLSNLRDFQNSTGDNQQIPITSASNVTNISVACDSQDCWCNPTFEPSTPYGPIINIATNSYNSTGSIRSALIAVFYKVNGIANSKTFTVYQSFL